MTAEIEPDTSTSETEGSTSSGWKRRRRVVLALALGLIVLPVQVGMVAVWTAATDVTVVEALARLLGMTASGLPGYFLLSGLAALLFALVAFAVTYGVAVGLLPNRKLALATLGSAVAVTLVTGFAVTANRSTRTAKLTDATEALSRQADARIEALSTGTRVLSLRAEPGPLYRSMGAITDNPRPEWGELRWSVRIRLDLRVPSAGDHELTVEYWLPTQDAPHATRERTRALEEGTNSLTITLDANDSRDYQGFWDPERSGGRVVVLLRRKLSPEELYGDGLGALGRRAERLFGAAAADLQPTSRTVEVLRESFEL